MTSQSSHADNGSAHSTRNLPRRDLPGGDPMIDREIQVFTNGTYRLEFFTGPDGRKVIDAAQVARYLSFRDAHRLAEHIPAEHKGYTTACTPGGDQRILYLTLPGFVRAVGQRQPARIKDAGARASVEKFQEWALDDVIPTVMETGHYSMPGALVPAQSLPPAPQSYPEALRALAAEWEMREAAERQLAIAAPKAAVADALIDAEGDYSLRKAAQILSRDYGIKTGQNRLMRSLYELKWVDVHGIPYQHRIEGGWLRTRVQTYPHPRTGEPMLGKPQIRVTGKGIAELHRLLSAPAGAIVRQRRPRAGE